MEITESNREFTAVHSSRFPASDLAIPGYDLIRQIGEGTYGAVWLAKHLSSDSYRAVKIISQKAGRSRREIAGLLTYERLAASHPSLLQILDLQVGGAGPSYYAMELADDLNTGARMHPSSYLPKTLASEIRRGGRMAVADCLKFCEPLLEALAHLHEHGLIHRDIKPSNIVFVNGHPKLADVGLITEVAGTLSYGGTEGYIPPEGPSTKQADIFAFGKVLYEMSSGQERSHYPVFPPNIDKAPDALAFLELNEIILRACEDNPKVRYHSVAQLRRELTHLSQGGSIRQLRLMEQRKRQLKVATFVGALALVIATAVLSPVYVHKYHSEAARNQMVGGLLSEATAAINRHDMSGALAPLVDALAVDAGDRQRNTLHRVRINALLDQAPPLSQMWFGPKRYNHVSFSPDAKRLVAAQWYGEAEVFDVATGTRICSLQAINHGLETAAFDNTGDQIVTAGQDKTVRVWNAHTGKAIVALQHTGRVYSASFHPLNPERVISACMDGHAWLWDVKRKRVIQKFGEHGGQLFYAGFSPDGSYVVTAGTNGLVRIWNARIGQLVGRPLKHDSWVFDASFSPDCSLLATASFDNKAQLWEVATGRKVGAPMIHGGGVRGVEFSPDGQFLLTASWDATVRLWEVETTQLIGANPVLYHSDSVMHATFASHGRHIATASVDGILRVWDLAGSIADCLTSVTRTSTQPPSARSGGNQKGGDVVETNKRSNSSGLPPENGNTVAASRDGSLLAVTTGKTAEVINTKTKAKLFSVPKQSSAITSLAFSHNSRWLATAIADDNFGRGSAQIWDIASHRSIGPPLKHRDGILYVVFSNDDSMLVTCSEDRTAALWSLKTHTQIGPRLVHDERVLRAAFNSNGTYLATLCANRTVRVWDTGIGQLVTPRLECPQLPRALSFSAEGSLVISLAGNEEAEWTLSPTHATANELAALSRLLRPATTETPETLAQAWSTYVRSSMQRPTSPSAVMAWHKQRLMACEKSLQWRGASFHVNELLKLNPTDERLLSARHDILQNLGTTTVAPSQVSR